MTALADEQDSPLVSHCVDTQVVLPAKLSNIKKAEEFSSQNFKWNSSEEVLSILISFERHEAWLSNEVPTRPPNGFRYLFNKQNIKDYRKDGYTWKKRTSSSSYIREDHCKLKVYGVNCLNVLYTHSAIIPTFHRRIYWLLQNPDIALVHYLNLIEDDLSEQCTYAREHKKSNISCQIKSIFSGVAEHLIPKFEISEEHDASSSTPGQSLQQKKAHNNKKLFKITILPVDDILPTSSNHCAQSQYQVNLWMQTNNASISQLPVQSILPSRHSNHHHNGLPHGTSSPTQPPPSSPRTIQSSLLFSPVCNVTNLLNDARNSPIKSNNLPTASNNFSTQNARLPGSGSVTTTLNIPVGYVNAVRGENPENIIIPGTNDRRKPDKTPSYSHPNQVNSTGVGSQPLLFFSSSSIPAVTRAASILTLPRDDGTVAVSYSDADATLLPRATCVGVNSMSGFTEERRKDPSTDTPHFDPPPTVPSGDRPPLQHRNNSFHGSAQTTVSSLSTQRSLENDRTMSSRVTQNTSAIEAFCNARGFPTDVPSSITNPSTSVEFSSSPSSDYGSLLSESGNRFSGSGSLSPEVNSASSSHENMFDGPFRLPLPVSQNLPATSQSVFSSSHSSHVTAQTNDVGGYHRNTSTPLDSSHVDLTFDFPELNTLDDLDYAVMNYDLNSVLGGYFQNPVPEISTGVKEDESGERTILHSHEKALDSNEKEKEGNNNSIQIDVASGVGIFPHEQNSTATRASSSGSLLNSNMDPCTVTDSTSVNDIVMTTKDVSFPPSPRDRDYHSNTEPVPDRAQPEIISNHEPNSITSRDTNINISDGQPSIPAAIPGSACITDFSPEWSYPGGGVKVLVTGGWSSSGMSYTCLFDGCSVEAALVQVGVLRCFCPSHEPGLVTLQVACNGFIVSNACVFEYRAHDTPGDLNARHEWLTMDDARFKLALLERLERLESKLDLQTQTSSCSYSGSGQQKCGTFEERILSACRTLFQAKTSSAADLKRPYRGMTLLHLAAALGFGKLLREMTSLWKDSKTIELILQDLDPTKKDEFNCTPLMWACALGHRAAVDELLYANADSLLVPDACGRLPLQVARDRGYFEVVDCIEEFMTASSERQSILSLGSLSEDEEDPTECYQDNATGPYSPSLPTDRQTLPLETSYTDRACSPMHVEEVSNGGVLLSQALVQIHEMINEAERQADLENSQLQSLAARVTMVPMQLSPVQEGSELLTSPGGWGSAVNRFRSFSSASSQSSPHTPSSKSSLSPGSPGFLNSPHSSPGVPPDTKEFHEFLCSSKKLLEKNFSELTLTDREQQELYQAALIIQEAYRSYKMRRQQRDQEMQAAVLIQNHYRRYKQFVLYKKKTHAALIIQNQYRAYREHEQFKKSRRAAAIIQNQFRIYRQRRQSQKRRDEHKSKQQEARFMRQSSNRSKTSV